MTGMEKLDPQIIAQLFANTSLPDYGDDRNIRDWLQVKDCCRDIEAVLTPQGACIKQLGLGVKGHPEHHRRYAMPRSSGIATFELGSRSKPARPRWSHAIRNDRTCLRTGWQWTIARWAPRCPANPVRLSYEDMLPRANRRERWTALERSSSRISDGSRTQA
jgi:hypothetical protein